MRDLLIGFVWVYGGISLALAAGCSSPASSPPADGGGTSESSSPDAALDSSARDATTMADAGPQDAVSDSQGLDASDGALQDSPPEPEAGPFAPGSFSCATCPAGSKFCSGSCFETPGAPPSAGCDDPSACSCPTPNGWPTCKNGKCAVLSCLPGYGDCDGIASNGCEADLHSPTSCSRCGVVCGPGEICTPGGCASACNPPYTSCPNLQGGGSTCVDLSSDWVFCGACTATSGCNVLVNYPSDGFSVCNNGACSSQLQCAAGFTQCMGSCRDLTSDPSHCGACGDSCAGLECRNGVCGGAPVCPPGSQVCAGACVVESVDRANCGKCGNACTGTDECVLGQCVPRASTVIASGLNAINDAGGTNPFVHLVVDATNVYFVDGNGVHFVPKAGGAVKDIAPETGRPARVAVDDTYAYWSDNIGAAIMRAPKDGSGTPTLVTAATQPQGLVVDSTDVFWVSNLPGTDDNVHRAPKGGGTSTIFTSQLGGELDDIVTDGTFLYVAAQGNSTPSGTTQTAYTIPIAGDGGAGSSFVFLSQPMFGEKTYLAAHPGEFCVASVATCAIENCAGIQCNVGKYSTFGPTADLFVSAIAISPCALAYGELFATKETVVAPLRDVVQNRRAEYKLTTDQAVAIASDGERVYFIETGGSLRSLPIP